MITLGPYTFTKSDALRKSFDDIDATTDVDVTKKAIDDRITDYKKALADEKKRL